METIEEYRKQDAKQYWTIPHLTSILIKDWWLAEHHLNELPEYELPTIRQMYYRLSVLSDEELELLKRLYYVSGKQVTFDEDCAIELGITKKEFQSKRVATLRKLQSYREYPRNKINRDEFYKRIEYVYGKLLE